MNAHSITKRAVSLIVTVIATVAISLIVIFINLMQYLFGLYVSPDLTTYIFIAVLFAILWYGIDQSIWD